MSHELIVFVTTSSSDEASSIADALVSERLAACVNISTGAAFGAKIAGEACVLAFYTLESFTNPALDTSARSSRVAVF